MSSNPKGEHCETDSPLPTLSQMSAHCSPQNGLKTRLRYTIDWIGFSFVDFLAHVGIYLGPSGPVFPECNQSGWSTGNRKNRADVVCMVTAASGNGLSTHTYV